MALTPAQARAKADAVLAPIVTAVNNFETNWISSHQNYWQGIRTMNTLPADGTDTTPDIDTAPTNDVDDISWRATGISIPSQIPCSLQVMNHRSDVGVGYTIIAQATLQNKTFQKMVGGGTVNLGTFDWTLVPSSLAQAKAAAQG